MKLCMFSPKGMDLERGWPGRIDGDQIVQLAAQTLQAFFTGGGGAREHATYALAECDLRAPVLYPPAIRLFAPFKNGATPFFSFVSPHPVLGPEEALPHPAGTDELDYRVGVDGGDRRGRPDRRVHARERLDGPRPGASRARGGARPVEERRLRHLARADRRHTRRARRRVGRGPGERRGADCVPTSARSSIRGRSSSRMPRATRRFARATCSSRSPPKDQVSRFGPGTSSSSKATGSAC